jgi:hypothetical protein
VIIGVRGEKGLECGWHGWWVTGVMPRGKVYGEQHGFDNRGLSEMAGVE